MSADRLLALDLGTTGVRALVVAAGGQVLARAYRPLTTRYPSPGRVEQDPAEMWARSLEVMREALAAAGRGSDGLAGIGVVTQRATAVAWDARSGRPLTPAISWQDQRTVERVDGFKRMGIPLNTLASATKFEWWMRNDADVRKAASTGVLRLGTPEDWLTFKLTGDQVHVTDPGHASCTALFDAVSCAWADPLLTLFGVPREALPKLVATSEVVGETPADLLGVPVPVAARAGDQQAAAFAQGIHSEGQAKLTLGTSAMLDRHAGERPPDAAAGAYPLVLWQLGSSPLAFCLEGTVITAGAAVDWLVNLGVGADAAEVDRRAAEVPSAGGVVFVPALQGLGTPWLDDRATGLIGGLTRGTGLRELARAVLEGVAQRCVDVCEALEIDASPLSVDGGLAQSEVLLQHIADLRGVEVLRASETETTALGAAQLAGLAVGVYSSPSQCSQGTAEPRRFEPKWDPERREAARQAWARAVATTRDV